MTNPEAEDLSEFVSRIMKEKHLSRQDVKLRSGGRITDSYVSAIISRAASNLSIEKLKALAAGLRVSEMDVIRVAFGLAKRRDAQPRMDRTHDLVLVDLSKKMVLSPDVAEIVQEVLKLSPEGRAVLLQYVRRLGRAKAKTQRKGRARLG